MPSVLNFKNSSRKRRSYSASFLSEDLYEHAQHLSDDDFLLYQLEYMREVFAHFEPDCFSVCLASHDESGGIEYATRYVAFNHEKGTDKKYKDFSHLDEMDPAIFKRPGNAIYNTHVRSMDDWFDNEFYQGFKVPLGLNHTIILSFRFPFRTDLRVRFSYQTRYPKLFSDQVSKYEVEFYTLPFYYSWLHRYGAIDERTLKLWLDKLVGVTPLGLSLLRDMCTASFYSKTQTAQKWNISKRVIDNQFHNIYGSLRQNTDLDSQGHGYRSQLVDLTNHFSFLRFSGYSLTDQDLSVALRQN